MFGKNQKILKLTKKESTRRKIFYASHPEEHKLWDELLGKRLPKVAAFIAREYILRFRLPEGAFDFILKGLSTASWDKLLTTLERDQLHLYVPRDSWFRELMIDLLHSRLGRNDAYGDRDRPMPRPVTIFVGQGENKKKIKIPRVELIQCRHCWRSVATDPRNPSRKAPLCPEHRQHRAGTSEYNKRQYLIKHMERHKYCLREEIAPLYTSAREYGRGYEFIRQLALDSSFLLQCLPSYLVSLSVPLDSDTVLRRAFFMLGDKTVPGYAAYMATLDSEIEFSQNIFFPEIAPGIKPAPLSFYEILNAEAWLLAAKWKPL